MCGIVGYVGNNHAVPFLLDGLESLEYRGYDSAGISVCIGKKIYTVKKKGRLKVLRDYLLKGPELIASAGIGHTRWATHGEPSDINAHPQVSESGKISVIHNGIIENYIAIKLFLIDKGKTFSSDTDTEVIAQLIDYLYNGDILDAVKNAISKLKGSFALGILCADMPDRIIAVRKESPLIIGINDGENYIASDIPAVLTHTRNIYRMREGEIAVITSNDVKVYDFDGKPLNITDALVTIDWSVHAADKGGYDHFMIKEIMEQPKVLKATINPRISDNHISFENMGLSDEYLRGIDRVYFVACGSAYHVGCAAAYIIEKLVGIPATSELASEFRYKSPIIGEATLVVIISQSGETADSLAALREAKKKGSKVLSIVNVVGSSIANESDYVIYTWAGPEIAVATTKAYSTQLSVAYMLAVYIACSRERINSKERDKYINEISLLPGKVSSVLENKSSVWELAQKYQDVRDVFFIGRTIDYFVCMEGSLKLKEISYIHSEAYAAGELKHGTISLIEKGTLVVAIATQEELIDKTISNIREVRSRGALVLMITTEENREKATQVADDVIYIPKCDGLFTPSLSIIPLQLLSYYVALLRNCDIDKPRNLAKSVTVE